MKKIFVIVFLFVSVEIVAQQSDVDCRIATSYINQNMKEWGNFVDELNDEYNKTHSVDVALKRMIVRHLYLAYLLFNDSDSPQIDIQLNGFSEDLSMLENDMKYANISLAFKSPFLAYSALNNPVTAVYRLPMSFSAAKTAIEKSPQSPYSWSEYGNLQYCYALFIGGNFKDAIFSFQKAIAIIEKNGDGKSCNWYYINSLLFLAKSYEDNRQYAKAIEVYDKMLCLRPDYEAAKRWKKKNEEKL